LVRRDSPERTEGDLILRPHASRKKPDASARKGNGEVPELIRDAKPYRTETKKGWGRKKRVRYRVGPLYEPKSAAIRNRIR